MANSLLAVFAAAIAAIQARVGPERFSITYKVWNALGVNPVRYHYYQPIFDANKLPTSIWQKKDPLFGIMWNTEKQLALIKSLEYCEELKVIRTKKTNDPADFFHNKSFGPADAEILYSKVRKYKTSRVIEIGSGYSSLMMEKTLDVNRGGGLMLNTYVLNHMKCHAWSH